MCGIAGCLDVGGRTDAGGLQECIVRMTAALQHRGPDDSGLWLDPDCPVALGHRRLAVLDLSQEGRQPMRSCDGRFVVVFNGEIYNHFELRTDLLSERPLRFRGQSDTEVLVEALSAWGVERTIESLNGMFAIAVWDRQRRELILSRDRFGEKPLYYTFQKPWFCFASELKGLVAHGDLSLSIDASVIPAYAASGYIPEGRSIYTSVQKLKPGSILSLRLSPSSGGTTSPVKTYWSAATAMQQARSHGFRGTQEDALVAVRECMRHSVRRRMVADVPLGCLLSGGIDSSLIVAMMQSVCSRPVRTFTIGFPGSTCDEASHANAVAKHLGAQHTHIPASQDQVLGLVTKLPGIYDEPFADSSQLPSLLVSTVARQCVTVALTGDGGDEIFGGYNRYRWALRCARGRGTVRALQIAAGLIRLFPVNACEGLEDLLFRVAGDRLPFRNLRARSMVVKGLSHRDSFEQRYERLTLNHELLQSLYGSEPQRLLIPDQCGPGVSRFGALHWMMYRDAVTYLPGDCLVKLDRATMAVGLEARLPFLDPQLAELGWSLPSNLLLHRGRGKWILRMLLAEYVHPKLFERPKRGFSVPLGTWLRGPLREWASDLLSVSMLSRHNYFQPKGVAAMWREHLTGRSDYAGSLWPVLMFNAWHSSLR